MEMEALASWEEESIASGGGEEVEEETSLASGEEVEEETFLASGEEEVDDETSLASGEEVDDETLGSGEEVDDDETLMFRDEVDDESLASGEEVDDDETLMFGDEVDDESLASVEEVDDDETLMFGEEVDDETLASEDEVDDDETLMFGDEVDVDTDDNNNGDEPPRRPRSDSALRRGTDVYAVAVLGHRHNCKIVVLMGSQLSAAWIIEGRYDHLYYLYAAGDLCIRTERELIRRYGDVLPRDDCWLSQKIKECAWVLMESDGEYPAAAAALLAITTEAKLMCEMLSHGVERNATPVLLPGRLIRLSAFSVMLYRGGYQSDVSAAVVAMVNLTLASNFLLDSFGRYQSDTVNMIRLQGVHRNRLHAANDFDLLVQALARGTNGNAGTFTTGSTEEPIGSGTVGEDLSLAYKAEFWKDRSVKLLQELMRVVKVKLILFVFSVCVGVLLRVVMTS